MVLIPYAMDYTSTVRARVPKLVACEQCGHEYVYMLERTASGTGTSMLFLDNGGAQQRATARAHEEVAYKLEISCDPVPCPACGWYQKQMVARAGHLRYRWMTNLAILLFLFAGFFLLFAAGYTSLQYDKASVWAIVGVWVVFDLALLAAILCPVLKWKWSRRYDPNAEDVETRKERGRERAWGKEEFLKLMQERDAVGGTS